MLDVSQPLIESTRDGEIPWFPFDTHLNEIGHQVMAEAAIDWAATRDWKESRSD